MTKDEEIALTKKKILLNLEVGMNKIDSALLEGISKASMYRWMDEDKTFKTDVKKSIINYKKTLVKSVATGAKRDGKLALDVLERKYPKEYGKDNKVKLDGAVNLNVTELVREIKNESGSKSKDDTQSSNEL